MPATGPGRSQGEATLLGLSRVGGGTKGHPGEEAQGQGTAPVREEAPGAAPWKRGRLSHTGKPSSLRAGEGKLQGTECLRPRPVTLSLETPNVKALGRGFKLRFLFCMELHRSSSKTTAKPPLCSLQD